MANVWTVAWRSMEVYSGMCYLCIVFGKLFEPLLKKVVESLKINTECFSWRLFQSIRTFALMSVANMFFRLGTFGETITNIKRGIMTWNPWILFDGSLYQLGLNRKNVTCLVWAILLLAIVDLLSCKNERSIRDIIMENNLLFRWGVWITMILVTAILGMYGDGYDAASFIYGNF